MSDTIGSTSAPCIDDISSSNSSSNSNSNSIISSSNTSAGKCPVDLETRSLWSLLGRGKPARNDKTATSVEMSGTPIPQQRAIPASLEEAARHAQTPHVGQRLPLSTHRLESTIPRSSTQGSTPPAHQINMNMNMNMNTNTTNPKSNPKSNTNPNPKHMMTADTWVYPSEQQVFNAMKRKGWEGIEEESIPSFLQIHNSVNERSWREVQQWEGTFGDDTTGTVELSRFEGRPKDLTPKAWFLSTLGIRDKPFDRHDWYVVHTTNNKKNKNNNDNNTETTEEKRYVLDFYMTEDHAATGVPKVEIDVRPALDSPGAFLQRGAGLLREVFPGITRELDERMTMMRNQR